MKIELAKNHGFCFGVKRAIDIAQKTKNANTFGPLIHNELEIGRLKKFYNVGIKLEIDEIEDDSTVIVRTHGIEKDKLETLNKKKNKVIDATCPFVQKPQQICEQMSNKGYQIVIYGDKNHPEIKSVKSYSITDAVVILSIDELKEYKLKNRVAIVSQTTKNMTKFQEIASYLIGICKEVRVFNTICYATFDNQDSAMELSKRSDVMIIIGGRHSSNTKQLYNICKNNCEDSFLIESKDDLQKAWFDKKQQCGITAGASTPDWIIQEIIEKIEQMV